LDKLRRNSLCKSFTVDVSKKLSITKWGNGLVVTFDSRILFKFLNIILIRINQIY